MVILGSYARFQGCNPCLLTIYLNSTLIQGVLTLLKRIQNAPSRFTNGKYLYNCQCLFVFCLWHQQIINPKKNKTVNNSCRTCLQQCTILSWISVLSRSKKKRTFLNRICFFPAFCHESILGQNWWFFQNPAVQHPHLQP